MSTASQDLEDIVLDADMDSTDKNMDSIKQQK